MPRLLGRTGLTAQSPLETYLREIDKTPLLTTAEEVAQSMNLPKKKLVIIKKAIQLYNAGPQSDQGETGWSLDEMLMDGNSETPDKRLGMADDVRHILDLLEKLDTREATVLRM